MRFFITLCCALTILISCDKEGETFELDCSAVNGFTESFIIELVDADGNNLIENGTYDSEHITVLFNGKNIGGVPINEDFNTIINFALQGEGTVDYLVLLNEQTTDTLRLDLTINSFFTCGEPDYTVNSASYNGVLQELIEGFAENSKIIVVK